MAAQYKYFTLPVSIYMTEKDGPKSVVIQAQSFIKQPPEELIFKYDKKYFEITPAKLSQLGVNYGGAPHKEKITIKCLSTFDYDRCIRSHFSTGIKEGMKKRKLLRK